MIVVGETGQFRWVARDADDGSWETSYIWFRWINLLRVGSYIGSLRAAVWMT